MSFNSELPCEGTGAGAVLAAGSWARARADPTSAAAVAATRGNFVGLSFFLVSRVRGAVQDSSDGSRPEGVGWLAAKGRFYRPGPGARRAIRARPGLTSPTGRPPEEVAQRGDGGVQAVPLL